jgi:hypothetical protein
LVLALCGFKATAQPRNVALWWRAELLLVIAAEVGRIFVAHTESGARRVQVFAEHQTACFLESYLFLELQRAHRRDRLEVMMKARNAHSKLARDVFNFLQERAIIHQNRHTDIFRQALKVDTQDVKEEFVYEFVF